MDIQLLRIDDRLIHGQVVVGWAPVLGIQRLVVVNDEVAANPMRRTLMEIAVPGHLKVSFHKVMEAAQACGKPGGEKALLLFSRPADVWAFREAGGPVERVNIGGLHFSEGRRQVGPIVCVPEEDVAVFRRMKSAGIELEVRAVPGDPGLPLEQQLPEILVP